MLFQYLTLSVRSWRSSWSLNSLSVWSTYISSGCGREGKVKLIETMDSKWGVFKTAYLSQFSTYRYETPLFGILTSRRFQRGVKHRPTPIQSRDIERNVRMVRIRIRPNKNGKITFTFCSISLDWMGVGQHFTPRWKLLVVRILKSGVSYLCVKNWLRYAIS